MTQQLDKLKNELIGKAVKRAGSLARGGAADVVRGFVERYFANVPPRDLLDRSEDSLARGALAHWTTARQRKPGVPIVRVFRPDAEKDGWATEHTLVEIVTDDMPFLVDSVTMALNRLGLTVYLVIHPIMHVKRDAAGKLLLTRPLAGTDTHEESFMHFEATAQPADRMAELETEITRVLANVRSAVEDWQPMRNELQATAAELSSPPAQIPASEVTETHDFLSWLYDNHFTLLGFRDYDYVVQGKRMTPISSRPGLGVMRDPEFEVFKDFKVLSSITPEIKFFLSKPDLLMVTKSNPRSTVHRPVHMDAIGIKRFGPSGKVVGQRIFVGLFTSSAYSRSPREIPLLRRKIATAFKKAGLSPTSHDGKALAHILESFPRDELFQVSEQHLLQTALGILHLQERQRVALFIRRDSFERFLSCLVYVPRDQYTTGLRSRIQTILEKELGGTLSTFYTQLDDSPLARVHFIIRTTPGKIPAYDAADIESQLGEIARSWADRLHQALFHSHGEGNAEELFRRYRDAFPAGYQERISASVAVTDIAKIEQALKTNGLALSLHSVSGAHPAEIGLKLFNVTQPIPLSDVLPILEHMGLRVINEIPDEIAVGAGTGQAPRAVFIHDFGLHTKDGKAVDIEAIEAAFAEALGNVWRGVAESDGFNALVLRAGLGWRDVVVLRAFAKYLRQTGIAFSQNYMEETLFRNPALAILVVELFHARFDTAAQDKAASRVAEIKAEIELALDHVTSADEDRIMRRFFNVANAMLRTNFFQKTADGEPKSYLSFKLDSEAVDELPQPRPLREIFVYSPRVEGIHLRFGLVARGGLRWSDRREDFRTEILGLVKAQHVKNAVIVPVGSKGGFVVKQLAAASDREAVLKEGIACYQDFIRGLLDLTDNLKGSTVIPPKDVVRHDGDDPYLVVAADKGTATFSDIANGVSLKYNFWLGDAFASGGSAGYDHKKMGITARGAWESVKRHFRELNRHIQSEDFAVIGVGDMSGDVFGNGMLLSPHIRLQAAFNHLHIFLDPDPDTKASLSERARLFALPRSSWADYDAKLISKGGGIFERTAKSIPLSPEVRKVIGTTQANATPNELIRMLLRAKTDLLWFGGIGTYIKETGESDAQVGDRSNDFVRINADQVGAQVIGEGANLGVTQRGRIQYALNGGRINQDSIDNSAGVDCSDHEVNIKILLNGEMQKKNLSLKERNALLVKMTEDVGSLVLRDNYYQTQLISLTQFQAPALLDSHARLIRMLERNTGLDRALEALPDDETITERSQRKLGLTRHTKNWLYDQLLKSSLPDDPHLACELVNYFPPALCKNYTKAIKQHRLRREITATAISNKVVNRAGETFVTRFMEKTSMGADEICRAFIAAVDIFGLDGLWAEVESLDNKVPAAAQSALLCEIDALLEWIALWFLRNAPAPDDLGAWVADFKDGARTLLACIEEVVPPHYLADTRNRATRAIGEGVPERLAMKVAGLVNLFSACDIVRLANRKKLPVRQIAELYFAIGTRFRLGRLRAAAATIDHKSHWQRLALDALVEETFSHQRALTEQLIAYLKGKTSPAAVVEAWAVDHRRLIDQTEQFLIDLWSTPVNDMAQVAVASRQLRALASGGRS